MSNQSPEERVQQDLARAVAIGVLPKKVHEQAQRLLTRLESPVRLALLGRPGTGKSTLLNLLVGQDVLDTEIRLPTLELRYGDTEQAICTLTDGSKTQLDQVSPGQIAALAPAFVELHMPLPALRKISLLEVVAPDDTTALHRASQWAANRCDIALWCTLGFDADEQRIWSQMPDLIKDHALLMITHLDRLQASGTFDTVLAAVTSVAADEFNKILPIATDAAIAARAPDGTVNKDALRQSGGMALISAVLKEVEQGRRMAFDLAEVLLLQNEALLADVTSAPEATDEKQTAAPQPAPTPEPTSLEKTIAPPAPPSTPKIAETKPRAPAPAAGNVSPLRRPTAVPNDAERVAVGISRLRNIAAARAEQPAPATELHPKTRAAYQEAVQYLQTHAAQMAAELDAKGEAALGGLIKQAVTHLTWLSDHLGMHGDDRDVSLQRARDAAFDASDLVQLMEMERRDSAAIEAVSLMLQLKREMSADLAA